MENDRNGNNWRLEAEKVLSSFGIICFNPYSKIFIDSDKLEEGENAHKLFKSWFGI